MPQFRSLATLVLLGALFAGTQSGCSLLNWGVQSKKQPDLTNIPPDTPVALRPGAAALKGKSADEVWTNAAETLRLVDLTSQTVRDVATKARRAVVSIYTKTREPYQFKWLPLLNLPGSSVSFTLPGQALGSGFFVHSSGLLLTNNHVIQNARQVSVRTWDGRDFTVDVIARDPVLDLALMQVSNATQPFEVLEVGDSEEVTVGDHVIALGNPLGLGHTVTAGIISQTGRQLHQTSPVVNGRQIRFLQTDTAINPGSSGGPLITLTGACVGVNTAVLLGTQGIAFAVPSDQVKDFITGVIAGTGKSEERPKP